MTSLTPNRDAVRKGLDLSRQQLDAIALTPLGQHEKRMSFDVMEASMLAAADMVDAGFGEEVRQVLVSAFANSLMSHAMNLASSDRRRAAAVIMELVPEIGSLALERIVRGRPDVEVYSRTCPGQTGSA